MSPLFRVRQRPMRQRGLSRGQAETREQLQVPAWRPGCFVGTSTQRGRALALENSSRSLELISGGGGEGRRATPSPGSRREGTKQTKSGWSIDCAERTNALNSCTQHGATPTTAAHGSSTCGGAGCACERRRVRELAAREGSHESHRRTKGGVPGRGPSSNQGRGRSEAVARCMGLHVRAGGQTQSTSAWRVK